MTAVDPADGSVVWEVPFTQVARAVSSPVIAGDLLIANAGAYTHEAYAAFPRMEPGRILQGHACAALAYHAIKDKTSVHQASIEKAQLTLLREHGQSIVYQPDSISGADLGIFREGTLILKDSGDASLLTANVIELRIQEISENSGCLAGIGLLEITGGSLESDFGQTSGQIIQSTFQLAPVTASGPARKTWPAMRLMVAARSSLVLLAR